MTDHLDRTAIPVTPEDLGVVITALHVEDRVVGTVETAGYSRGKAAILLERAGAAAALGHQTIPLLVSELYRLDLVLQSLQLFARTDPRTAEFVTVLARLTAQAGAARIHGWTAVFGPAGLQWETTATGPTTSVAPTSVGAAV